MMKKLFPFLGILAIGVFFFGLIWSDPFSSKTSGTTESDAINPVVPVTNAVVKYVDSLNGANDTVALRTRGYIPKRGPNGGPAGTSPNWFQGNSTVFAAFNGPATGYVAANFNNVTGTNPIDLWLISPVVNGASGDTLSFYERGPTGSTFPDSIRVYWASNGDTVPGSGSWVELGRFKTTLTGSWAERRFTLPSAGANGRFAINYRVVNGGPSGVNSDFIGIDFIRLLGPAAPPPGSGPDLLYYKFENNPNSTTVLNCAIPGVGNPTPTIAATTLTSGGQFDSCLAGTNLTNAGVTPGWNWDLGTSSWTISFWLTMPSSTSISYIFGDAGSNSFRCFSGGVAGADNLLVRFTSSGGSTDEILINGTGPNSTVVTIVHDSAAGQIRAYKNGVFSNSVTRVTNMPLGSGFRVGGYSTSAGLRGTMDEFRLYRRALTPAEITATWNSDLSGCGIVGISHNGNEVPNQFKLSQNYPNPFNPVTNIKFALPNTGLVKISVFDILGREVETLVNEVMVAGNYTVDFDASKLSSGVYFYRLESGNFTDTKKMLLVK
ncbi:MAG: choice-of-anchor J domain-containing protein [Ignavibacteria bacterium]|nr:choice-of-anchor J domain-containing protein [Ignavibacteria bacterium]